MTSFLRRLLIAVLGVGTLLGLPVILHYGAILVFMSYLTVWLTAFMLLGFRWLGNSAPHVSSAEAVRTLLRLFWVASGVLSGITVAAAFRFSSSTFWLLPLPFSFPALSGSIFYERTFRRIENLPFWRKGL